MDTATDGGAAAQDGAGAPADNSEKNASDNPRAAVAAAAAGNNPAAPEGGVKGDVKAAADAPVDWAKDTPDNLRGADEVETLGKLNAAYLGLRKKLSEGKPDIPDSPDGYEVNLGEKYTEVFGDAKDDPALAAVKKYAHENQIAPDVLQGVAEAYVNAVLESGAVEKPMTMDAYYEGLGGKEDGGKIVGDLAAYANNLMTTGAFGDLSTPEGKAAAEKTRETVLDMIADKPEYALALNAIRNQQKEPGMTLPGGGNEGGFELTIENLRKAQADPRYDTSSAKFDKAYRAKIDNLFAEFDKSGG